MAVFLRHEELNFKMQLEPGDTPVLVVIRRGDTWCVAINPELGRAERLAAWQAIEEYRRRSERTN